MKKDIYTIITEQVIKGLEKTGLNWFKSWSAKDNLAINHVTGKAYTGINQMLLGFDIVDNNYTTGEFMTFKQAQKLGGKVKKGSVSHIVVFWNISYYILDGTKRVYFKKLEDVPAGEKAQKSMSPRFYKVFNLDSIEGISPKHDIAKVKEGTIFEPIERADEVYKNMRKKPSLAHGGNRAFYRPLSHSIQMPSQETFTTPDDYYKVFFHELTHSTGHESILNRGLVGSHGNKTKYSKEELVAEMGALFLCGILDLNPKDSNDNSQAYINGWIKYLKNHPKEILSASSKSRKAIEYILNK